MGLALDEPKENEKPQRINELEVFMDNRVKFLAEDYVLDYDASLGGRGFVIGPQFWSSCK